jgi:AcrR family transcriptional regulator
MAEIGIDRVRTRAVAERAGVNQALVHYYFGSISALVMEAAEHALIQELGPSIDALGSGATIHEGVKAMLKWIEHEGQRTPGSPILVEAMVKATRDPAFRRWTRNASRRFRALILERLETAQQHGEVDPALDLQAAAVLLAAAFDGLLFHRLVDARLDVAQTSGPISAMLTPSHSVHPPARLLARGGQDEAADARGDR